MKNLLFCFVGLLTLVFVAIAEPVAHKSHHQIPSLLSENWTASDKPYTEVVNKLNDQYAHGKSLEPLVQQYKSLALIHPNDPLAQFAWISAEYAQFRSKDTAAQVPSSFAERMDQADPGNVHQFARYRLIMLLKTEKKMSLPPILKVGDRLLQYDPKDKVVRKALIDYLIGWEAGDQNALRYALEGVKLEPENASTHSSLALVYQTLWASDRTKNKIYASQAVTEYQAYLRLAPPDAPFRKDAEYLNGVIRKQTGL